MQTYGGGILPSYLRCTAWTWLSTSMEVRMNKRFWKDTPGCTHMS